MYAEYRGEVADRPLGPAAGGGLAGAVVEGAEADARERLLACITSYNYIYIYIIMCYSSSRRRRRGGRREGLYI